ncbi:unnamed protein product [Rotaria sp. Silwood1]|nr:unnamed protein product [Rotaria sp. Silwood1]
MMILHRSVISNLSFLVVQNLKKIISTEDDWDYLISVSNVLSKIYEACRWLSGKHYQTLSIVYVIKRGVYHVLTQPSSSPQAKIENIIKKYLLIAFKYHFDEKLSVEQKEAILIAAYLDRKVYRKMLDEDKYVAEQVIINKLSTNAVIEQNHHDSCANPIEEEMMDPLDHFLSECGLTDFVSSTTKTSNHQRSGKEEVAFYADRVQENNTFEQFRNSYQNELPAMFDLVRSYNIRPATSVASEGLFSIAGNVQRKSRSSLLPKALKYTIVLRDQNIVSYLIQSMNSN